MKTDRVWLKAHRVRCARKREARRKPTPGERLTARELARRAFEAVQSSLPPVQVEDAIEQGYVILAPPTKLDFEDEYSSTLAFFMEFRVFFSETRKFYRPYSGTFIRYAAFEDMDDLSTAAGLVLVAELKRWMRSRPRSHDRAWAQNISDFFHDFGLFEVLGVTPQTTRASVPGAVQRRPLKFRFGTTADGEIANSLRAELEDLCGGSIGPARAIYKAITEAMTNSRQHAYPSGTTYWPKPPSRRWWAGGSWSPQSGTVHVIIYDQGVGIPSTLPRSKLWPQIKRLLQGKEEMTDAGLLRAALEVRRTATEEPGRGKGFKDMTDWIDLTGKGFLRVLSGRGQVSYKAGGKIETRKLPAPFLGTLVEWEIALNG